MSEIWQELRHLRGRKGVAKGSQRGRKMSKYQKSDKITLNLRYCDTSAIALRYLGVANIIVIYQHF